MALQNGRHLADDISGTSSWMKSFIQAQIKENIKDPRHWLCEGNSPVTDEFPTQRASNVKKFPFDDVIIILS